MRHDSALGRARPVEPADRAAVLDLASDDAFAALRYLRLFGHDVAALEQRDRIATLLDGPGHHVAIDHDGELAGVALATVNADLSEHFGVPCVEVGALLVRDAGGTDRAAGARALLEQVVELARGPVPALVILRLEGDDHRALSGAERAGFRLRETSLTFVNDLSRRDRNPPRERDDVRLHRHGVDPVEPAVLAPLRPLAARVTHSHYHTDPRLPEERCAALYERVFDRALQGIGADVIAVAYEGDRAYEFGTWRHWHHLEPYGVSIAGSSFGLRAPWAPRGSAGATTFVCNEPLTGNRLLEWSTQATNYGMVNLLFRQPSIRLCRTSHVLHAWTDEGWG